MAHERGETSKGFVAGTTAVVLLMGAILTVVIQWDDWVEDEAACTVSGTAFFREAGSAAPGVRIGWTDTTSTATPVQISISGPDGSYSGDCRGASEQFQLVYQGYTPPGQQLPCLTPSYPGIVLANPGVHANVNIPVTEFC